MQKCDVCSCQFRKIDIVKSIFARFSNIKCPNCKTKYRAKLTSILVFFITNIAAFGFFWGMFAWLEKLNFSFSGIGGTVLVYILIILYETLYLFVVTSFLKYKICE
ncbi:MAG: hypothetical protein CVV03_11620 [Firmicutes bacterium HGW-Firmicutes-8]|nr:MAG: hypothetical protein CVV03_11620 [Firmicutes bacterium HGW-Firmicutes-8]